LDVQARNGKKGYLFDKIDYRLRHLIVLTKKPTLLVLAAGLGSRYPKQLWGLRHE